MFESKKADLAEEPIDSIEHEVHYGFFFSGIRNFERKNLRKIEIQVQG